MLSLCINNALILKSPSFYALIMIMQWFPPHFLSSCAGNFPVFLVDSSLLLTNICENAQLTRHVVFNSTRKK